MEPALKMTLKSVVKLIDTARDDLTEASITTDNDEKENFIFAADQKIKIAAERVDNIIAFFEGQIKELEREIHYVDNIEAKE